MVKKIVLFVYLILFVNCERDKFSKFKTFPNGWDYNDKLQFEFSLKQTNPLDIFINIRNNNSYKFSNIFLIAKLRDSTDVIFLDTLEYVMADSKGNWLGKGFLGVKENRLWWKEKWEPNKKGIYSIELSHSMRHNGKINKIENLEGIIDVGVSIMEEK